MMQPVISVINFSKSFGKNIAVKNLSLDVEKGELFGLIGPDGAGKTTTIRTLVTLISPDSGELSVTGLNVSKNIREIRSITGYMPQRFSLYPDLSVSQNLNFFANLFEVPKKEMAERRKRLFKFSNLEPFSERLAGQLSGGMKQKLALSCTLIHNPVVLILDEPTTGLDPQGMKEIRELIIHLSKDQKKTIFLSSHILYEVEMVADRMIIINKGSTQVEGSVEELLNRNDLKVTFEVDDTQKVLELVKETAWIKKLNSETKNRVIFSLRNTEIAELNKYLVDNKISVSAVVPTRSLEEYFLQITEKSL